MSSSSSIPPSSVRAIAWDPRAPATLMVSTSTDGRREEPPSTENSSSSGNNNTVFQMNPLLSHTGAGCNTYETSALFEMLDARDAYLESDVGEVQAMLSVSRAYRKALNTCVTQWEESLTTTTTSMQQEGDEMAKDMENLELSKSIYAITHLSETFLLAPSNNNESFIMDLYENPSSLPGAVTADTVRYLRLHHMSDPTSFVDDEIIKELETSLQPDQVDDGSIYWKLINNFLIRGCLQDVWALLSRHSLRRRAMESISMEGLDDYENASLAEDRHGFRALEAVLLSAPLPGGRTDEFDADMDMETILANQQGVEELLQGIPSSGFLFWESHDLKLGSGDYPVTFQPHTAVRLHQAWQQAVKSLPELQILKRRIPELRRVLACLSGDLSDMEFESWAEELCADLIYRQPSVRLMDMHVFAARAMRKYDTADRVSVFDDVILNVMKGNAGRVIEVLHDLGGGSGAALPAVMTSLLFDLLNDAQIMPELSTEFSIQTELLLMANFAIRSSFAAECHHDVGTRLAVRLLIPHITNDSDLEITATLVDTMEHHAPETDAEANALLDLCRKLVERKNVRVLDACVSIALARYRHFLNDQRPGGAVHWLLTTMNLESLVICPQEKNLGRRMRDLSASVSYRLLATFCMRTSEGLMKGILGEDVGASSLYASGKEICLACKNSDMATSIPEVKVLQSVVTMAEAIAEQKDDAIVGRNIIACLEERPNDEDDGVVSTLAVASMHWDLIRLAKMILDRNSGKEKVEDMMHLFSAAFNVRGMQVLLERFTVIVSTLKMKGQDVEAVPEIQKIRLAFAEGLMHAFVAENALKKSPSQRSTRLSLKGVYAADLGKHSREKQELIVQNMLDF